MDQAGWKPEHLVLGKKHTRSSLRWNSFGGALRRLLGTMAVDETITTQHQSEKALVLEEKKEKGKAFATHFEILAGAPGQIAPTNMSKEKAKEKERAKMAKENEEILVLSISWQQLQQRRNRQRSRQQQLPKR